MLTYPIRVTLKASGDKRKALAHNQLAPILEAHINERAKASKTAVVQIDYHDVAKALRLTVDEVRDVLMTLEGGHNGLTIQMSEG